MLDSIRIGFLRFFSVDNCPPAACCAPSEFLPNIFPRCQLGKVLQHNTRRFFSCTQCNKHHPLAKSLPRLYSYVQKKADPTPGIGEKDVIKSIQKLDGRHTRTPPC
jgi:hypothetical protein